MKITAPHSQTPWTRPSDLLLLVGMVAFCCGGVAVAAALFPVAESSRVAVLVPVAAAATRDQASSRSGFVVCPCDEADGGVHPAWTAPVGQLLSTPQIDAKTNGEQGDGQTWPSEQFMAIPVRSPDLATRLSYLLNTAALTHRYDPWVPQRNHDDPKQDR